MKPITPEAIAAQAAFIKAAFQVDDDHLSLEDYQVPEEEESDDGE